MLIGLTVRGRERRGAEGRRDPTYRGNLARVEALDRK